MIKKISYIVGGAWLFDESPHGSDTKAQQAAYLSSSAVESVIRSFGFDKSKVAAAQLILGSQYGRIEFIEKGARQAAGTGYKDYINPNHFVHSITAAVSGSVAIKNGIRGNVLHINTGELSGLDAMGYAHAAVQTNDGIFFAGGVDSTYAIRSANNAEVTDGDVGGAGILAICNENEQRKNDLSPVALIKDYSSCKMREGQGEGLERLAMMLEDHRTSGSNEKIFLVTFGDLIPGPAFTARYKDILSGHYHIGAEISRNGAAYLAIIMCKLVMRKKIGSSHIIYPGSSCLLLAGIAPNSSFTHILISFPNTFL